MDHFPVCALKVSHGFVYPEKSDTLLAGWDAWYNGEIHMAIDPVCLAIVDEDGAQYTSEFKNQKYYFCCNYCRKQFEENPKRHTRIAHDICVDLNSSHNRI